MSLDCNSIDYHNNGAWSWTIILPSTCCKAAIQRIESMWWQICLTTEIRQTKTWVYSISMYTCLVWTKQIPTFIFLHAAEKRLNHTCRIIRKYFNEYEVTCPRKRGVRRQDKGRGVRKTDKRSFFEDEHVWIWVWIEHMIYLICI